MATRIVAMSVNMINYSSLRSLKYIWWLKAKILILSDF